MIVIQTDVNIPVLQVYAPHRGGLVVSVFASHVVRFASRSGHTKDHPKMVQTASLIDTRVLA